MGEENNDAQFQQIVDQNETAVRQALSTFVQ